MISLSVIVASSGRPTLTRTLDSLASQLRPGDELLVDVNDDAPWGHAARNRMMDRADGDMLLFMDDDDTYMPNAFQTIREKVDDPSRMHIFRMRYSHGGELWTDPVVRCGNVSTQMIVVPNRPLYLGRWTARYEGDFDFITDTLGRLGTEPCWHEDVIARVRP